MITTENESFSKIILNWLKKESSLALNNPVKFSKNFKKTSGDKFGNCIVINPKEHRLVLTTYSHFLNKLICKGCICLYSIDVNQIEGNVDTYIKNSFSDYLLGFNISTFNASLFRDNESFTNWGGELFNKIKSESTFDSNNKICSSTRELIKELLNFACNRVLEEEIWDLVDEGMMSDEITLMGLSVRAFSDYDHRIFFGEELSKKISLCFLRQLSEFKEAPGAPETVYKLLKHSVSTEELSNIFFNLFLNNYSDDWTELTTEKSSKKFNRFWNYFNNKLLRADSLNNSLFEDLISETLKGSIDFLDVSGIKEREYKVSADFIKDGKLSKDLFVFFEKVAEKSGDKIRLVPEIYLNHEPKRAFDILLYADRDILRLSDILSESECFEHLDLDVFKDWLSIMKKYKYMLKKYNIEDIYNKDCITGLQNNYSDWVACQSIPGRW
jgi:hypothetical protein